MSDEYAPNEPVHTGWLRTLMLGDRDVAKTHVREARTLLGQMRSITGINDRIAAGEAGGFYKWSRQLDDGSRITAYSNNGLDTITIETPAIVAMAEQRQQLLEAEGNGSAEPLHVSVPVSHEEVPVPPLPWQQKNYEEEEEEEKKEEEDLYLWIGSRMDYSSTTGWAYFGCPFVIEPDNEQAVGFLHDAMGASSWGAELDTETTVAPDGKVNIDWWLSPAATDNRTLDDLFDELQEVWGTYSQPAKQRKHHNFALYDRTADSTLWFTTNGLRLYSSNSAHRESDFAPVDPLMTLEQNQGSERSFAGSLLAPEQTDFVTGWDHTFFLDPYEDDGMPPVDDRPVALATSHWLQALGMASREQQVLAGEYLFGIMGQGDPSLMSTRAGEALPITPTMNMTGFPRNADADYREYLAPPNFTLPMTFEVEIRLGKEAMNVTPLTMTVDDVSEIYQNILPFGYLDPSASLCKIEGPNSMGPNYSHPLVGIDVYAGTVRFVDDKPAPYFDGGDYPPMGTVRAPCAIYVFGDYPLSMETNPLTWQTKAGTALHETLERITTGAYSFSEISELPLGAAIALFAGTDAANPLVYRIDGSSHSFTALPLISSSTDYDYSDQVIGGVTYPSWYKPWLYWYYPYYFADKYACRDAYAVLVTGEAMYSFDLGQTIPSDRPLPNCC